MTVRLDRRSRSAVLTIRNMNSATRSAIISGGHAAGKALVRSASNEILNGVKSGRIYSRRTRDGAVKRHQASAPFETHADFNGDLRRALSYKSRPHELEYGYGVDRNDAPIHAIIEFGVSKRGVLNRILGRKKIQPRPTLFNAIKSEARNLEGYYRGSMQDALNV